MTAELTLKDKAAAIAAAGGSASSSASPTSTPGSPSSPYAEYPPLPSPRSGKGKGKGKGKGSKTKRGSRDTAGSAGSDGGPDGAADKKKLPAPHFATDTAASAKKHTRRHSQFEDGELEDEAGFFLHWRDRAREADEAAAEQQRQQDIAANQAAHRSGRAGGASLGSKGTRGRSGARSSGGASGSTSSRGGAAAHGNTRAAASKLTSTSASASSSNQPSSSLRPKTSPTIASKQEVSFALRQAAVATPGTAEHDHEPAPATHHTPGNCITSRTHSPSAEKMATDKKGALGLSHVVGGGGRAGGGADGGGWTGRSKDADRGRVDPKVSLYAQSGNDGTTEQVSLELPPPPISAAAKMKRAAAKKKKKMLMGDDYDDDYDDDDNGLGAGYKDDVVGGQVIGSHAEVLDLPVFRPWSERHRRIAQPDDSDQNNYYRPTVLNNLKRAAKTASTIRPSWVKNTEIERLRARVKNIQRDHNPMRRELKIKTAE